MKNLPPHLSKYVVDQDYEKYTPVDQATWRFILRQLRSFLADNAHPFYLEGLEKTGISVDVIPRISDISKKLEQFGWRALPVSGFIPPAAFMELQSLSILPIASDMRSLEHLEYTPAPDIVHEAAGHAPMLAHPEFADYLKQYAQVARHAIISRQDLAQYEAIRELSDLKEHPESTPEQIQIATQKLEHITQNMGSISEAGELSRMNWWTAEYGLIGDLENPKILGAGLLSSVGESKWCLSNQVRKIPLTVDCLRQGYDITEPQPQLFVTPDFRHLGRVLEEMASQMAFRIGGKNGFEKAVRAESVNTLELNNGLQISGQWSDSQWREVTVAKSAGQGDPSLAPIFVKAVGPCQICYQSVELPAQGRHQHPQGFSTPLGAIAAFPNRCPSQLSTAEWTSLGLVEGRPGRLEMQSGFIIEGVLEKFTRIEGKTLLLTWQNCTVTANHTVYFHPEWGAFDQALGLTIRSVSGGPADAQAFGQRDDFVAARVQRKKPTPMQEKLFHLYQTVRTWREALARNQTHDLSNPEKLTGWLQTYQAEFPSDWLLGLEILEILQTYKSKLNSASLPAQQAAILNHLKKLTPAQPALRSWIEEVVPNPW